MSKSEKLTLGLPLAKVENQTHHTPMNYMQEVDAALRERLTAILESGADPEEFIKWLKTKLLESYRNGQAAGPKNGTTPVPAAPPPAPPRPPRQFPRRQ